MTPPLTALHEKVNVIPANPDAVAIARLYLERLPLMNAGERTLFTNILLMLSNPIWCVQGAEKKKESDNG